MRSFCQVAALAALGTLIACRSDQPVGLHTSPPVPRLAVVPQWAGGEVRIIDAAFSGVATLPTVTAGSESLSVRRVDDSTLSARMPAFSGSYVIKIQGASYVATLGPITLFGYRDELLGPYMSGLAAWVNPGAGGDPIVFSSGDSGGVLVDLSTNTVMGTVPDSITSPDCAQSPGASYRGAGYFALQGKVGGTCVSPISWQVYPSLVRADTSPISGVQWYVIAEVASKRWFSDVNNHSYVYDCSTACTSRSWLDPSGPTAVLIGAGNSRFTWMVQNYPGSGSLAAVLNSTALDTAYTMPAVGSLLSAAFSIGGDTMFTFAEDTALEAGGYHGFSMLALRASDGTVLHRAPLDTVGFGFARPSSWVSGMALDPTRPWLYLLAGVDHDSLFTPALVVVDRGSWSVIGVAYASNLSTDAFNTLRFNSAAVIPDPTTHTVFVVGTYYGYNIHQAHGVILRFDTP